MSKIDTLNSYIHKYGEVIKYKNSESAKRLEVEIVTVYSHEIKGLTDQLDYYFMAAKEPYDHIGDVEKLKAMLLNYRDNLELELSKSAVKRAGQTININQNNANTANPNATVTFEQTIKDIMHLDQSVLAEKDKELLQGKLLSIEQLKKSVIKTNAGKKQKASSAGYWTKASMSE